MKIIKKQPRWFSVFARRSSSYAGEPVSFITATVLVIVWLVTGHYFNYSDTWQLVINTGTTIITFLMVFIIQNTQNHDTEALQIKLDELLRATREAHNALLDLEELDDETLARFRRTFKKLAQEARTQSADGRSDKGSPDDQGL